MVLIDNEGVTDPAANLALEEVLLREFVQQEPLLLFYRNAPAVIVGRNQNIFGEVNLPYAQAQGIPVLRRLSGGGTVYHDLGNLNYCIICPEQSHLHDFAYFTAYLSDALRGLGVEAELRHRSSLFAGPYKISGNAQYATGGKLLHHGTLLFDADTAVLRQVISPAAAVIESRGVPSVRSEVTNLRDLLGPQSTLSGLMAAIIAAVERRGPLARRRLDPATWVRVAEVVDERYRDWEWTYGRSPRFTIRRPIEPGTAGLAGDLTVERGRIVQVAWHGTSAVWPEGALRYTAALLAGRRYEAVEMRAALEPLIIEEGQRGADIMAALLP